MYRMKIKTQDMKNLKLLVYELNIILVLKNFEKLNLSEMLNINEDDRFQKLLNHLFS